MYDDRSNHASNSHKRQRVVTVVLRMTLSTAGGILIFHRVGSIILRISIMRISLSSLLAQPCVRVQPLA